MGLYERADIYWYRFVWNGELIRENPAARFRRRTNASHC